MIIDDVNVKGLALLEAEYDSILIVDANTPLPFPTSLKGFEPVARRAPQVAKLDRCIDRIKPEPCDSPKRPRNLSRLL